MKKVENLIEFQKIEEIYFKVCFMLRMSCIEFLVEKLNNTENHKISFNDVDFDGEEDLPIITYDGSNDVENSSSLYNEVYSIYINDDGKIFCQTKLCEEYDICRASLDDIINICYYFL